MDWKTSESLLTGRVQTKPRRCVRDAEDSMLCVGGWIQHKEVPFQCKVSVILLSRNSNTHWEVGLGKSQGFCVVHY